MICHFTDVNKQLRTLLLAVRHIQGDHSGKNQAKSILPVLKEYDFVILQADLLQIKTKELRYRLSRFLGVSYTKLPTEIGRMRGWSGSRGRESKVMRFKNFDSIYKFYQEANC